MGQGKFKPQCGKLTYNTEQGAWEHVIHFRRKGFAWQRPYLCECGKWHLTSKRFDGKVPKWVFKYANRQPKKKRDKIKHVSKTLPLAEQKAIFKSFKPTVYNSPKQSWWSRIIKAWKSITCQRLNKLPSTSVDSR